MSRYTLRWQRFLTNAVVERRAEQRHADSAARLLACSQPKRQGPAWRLEVGARARLNHATEGQHDG